jgi:hypothetical protein
MNMARPTILVLLLAATACGTPPTPTSPAPTAQTPTTVSCQPTLTLDKSRFIADGDNATAQVTTSVDRCAWAVSAPSWITVTPSSGIGSQSVTVKAAATTGDERTGEIAIGAARVPVTQNAWSPVFLSARCRIARAGRNLGICTAVTRLGAASRERGGVTADLRPLNGPASWDFVYIIAGEWDLDLGVPEGFPAGVVPLTFSARDHSGAIHTITAELEVR